MKHRITTYIAYIDRILETGECELSYEELIAEHEKQLAYFMHERLIHLLVTLCFAILSFMTFFAMVFDFSYGLAALLVAFLILLVPYIMHYYLLENSVQYMYRQYDRLNRKIKNGAFILPEDKNK